MFEFASAFPSLSKHLVATPPDVLYHYTSPESLIGIVLNKQLWATNTMYLNDSKEEEYAFETIRFLIQSGIEHPHYPAHLTPILNRLSAKIGTHRRRSYMVSFTELYDSLSQWRAYCPITGGYAIGFPSNLLRDVTDYQPFKLVKCVYEWYHQTRILEELIRGFIAVCESTNAHNASEDVIENLISTWSGFIAQVALIIKHRTFEEENEWRLISFGIPDINNPNLGFRANHKGIIPFYKLNLSSPTYPSIERRGNDVLVIKTGPAADTAGRAEAANILIRNVFGAGCAQGISEIPYRTW